MESKKILIVEDDKMLSTISEMFLTTLGHRITGKVQSGQDAVEKCRTDMPDVVLMDIHIKGDIDGIQTSKLLQQEFDIPIIFLSSDVSVPTIMDAVIRNSYGFLVKPVDKRTLGTTIEFAYHKHRLDRNKQ